MIDEHMSVLNG